MDEITATIEATEFDTYTEVGATSASGRRYTVTVYHPDVTFGEPRAARINWAAYGSVDPLDAELYAQVLQVAVGVAMQLGQPD